MLNYKIAKLVDRQRGRVLLPQVQGSLAAEASYLKALRALLRALNRAVRTELVPAVEYELQADRAAAKLTRDIDAATLERIAQLGNVLGRVAENAVQRVLGLEASRHSEAFMKTAKSALGIDLSAVVRNEDLGDYLTTAATRSAGLIRGISQLTVQRVQTTVTNAVLQGFTVKQLRSTLAADFGFADRRAQLIARDQIGKLNSDLNRIRHQQAGITQYVWRTSQDERVRPRHGPLHGLVYDYNKPTGAENGLAPGMPIQCRCIAQAIVEFGDAPALPHGSKYLAIAAEQQPTPPRRLRRPRAAPATRAAPAVPTPSPAGVTPLERMRAMVASKLAERMAARAAPRAAPVVEQTVALTRAQVITRVEELEKDKRVKGFGDPTIAARFADMSKGTDPEVFFRRMGFHFDDGASVRVANFEGNNLLIEGAIDVGRDGAGKLSRTFIMDRTDQRRLLEVEHSYFELPDEHQGKGLAKRIVAQQIKLYQELGVKRVTTHANIDVGGYAWSKYGFVPAAASWERLRLRLMRNYLKLTGNEIDLPKDNPKSVWEISDLPNGLGKKLMLGTDWQGTLDLRDADTMRRFNAYVGQ